MTAEKFFLSRSWPSADIPSFCRDADVGDVIFIFDKVFAVIMTTHCIEIRKYVEKEGGGTEKG